MEEGRYSDTSKLSMPENVNSIKYIELDFGTPELLLTSSTNFKGKECNDELLTGVPTIVTFSDMIRVLA